LIRFGQNQGEISAKVIRFGQNQNFASPKAFDLLYGYDNRQLKWGKSHKKRSLYSTTFIGWSLSCANGDGINCARQSTGSWFEADGVGNLLSHGWSLS